MTVPPKDNPVRRNSRVGPTLLPAQGREGPAPDWPLNGDPSLEEKIAWARFWRTPQAAAWEQLGDGCIRTVARYTRMVVESEKPGASASLLGQVSNLEDKLGLTPRAMRMLLWQIAPNEVATAREGRSESVRERLRALETG